MEKRAQEIQTMFSAIVPRYDFLNRLLSGFQDVRWRKIAVRELSRRIPRPARMLDSCCGTGDLTLGIARRFRDARIVGTDFSRDMIAAARAKYNTKHAGRAAFLCADSLKLPFPDNTFDAATVAFGLRNLVDRRKGIEEMLRVIRPGGTILILEFSMPRNSLVRLFYSWYMRFILPASGFMVSGTKAYRYLRDSIFAFPPPEEIKSMMEHIGARGVEAFTKTLGVVTFYLGEKQ